MLGLMVIFTYYSPSFARDSCSWARFSYTLKRRCSSAYHNWTIWSEGKDHIWDVLVGLAENGGSLLWALPKSELSGFYLHFACLDWNLEVESLWGGWKETPGQMRPALDYECCFYAIWPMPIRRGWSAENRWHFRDHRGKAPKLGVYSWLGWEQSWVSGSLVGWKASEQVLLSPPREETEWQRCSLETFITGQVE